MARVTKPCPACKTTDHRRDGADEVCSECKRLLAFAKAELKRREGLSKDNAEIVRAPERDYAIDGFYSRGVHSDVSDGVKKAMHALIMSVTDPVSSAEGFPDWEAKIRVLPSSKTRDWLKCYRIKKSTATAIIELDTAIRKLQKAAETGAYEDGHNLLIGLASGEMSVKEFNEETEKR